LRSVSLGVLETLTKIAQDRAKERHEIIKEEDDVQPSLPDKGKGKGKEKVVIDLVDSDSELEEISPEAFRVARSTRKPAAKQASQPAPSPTPGLPQAPSEPSSPAPEEARPVQQLSIYELNPDQLRAEIATTDMRENRIRISMAYQQRILRETTPERQEFEEVMYKENQLFRALGLQGKRKAKLHNLLSAGEGN
jgi:hypothetical protein